MDAATRTRCSRSSITPAVYSSRLLTMSLRRLVVQHRGQTPGRPLSSARHRGASRFGEEEPQGHEGAVRVVHQGSEEHTSELQSHVNLVCRLLLEKKKRIYTP